MPDALLFTSTLVMGWIFPVATTDRDTSPRVTFANRLGSIEEPLTSRASATPAIATIRTTPTLSQTQNRLLFRDAANTTSPAKKAGAVFAQFQRCNKVYNSCVASAFLRGCLLRKPTPSGSKRINIRTAREPKPSLPRIIHQERPPRVANVMQSFSDILGQVFRAIAANKLRSFLTMFGIARSEEHTSELQ